MAEPTIGAGNDALHIREIFRACAGWGLIRYIIAADDIGRVLSEKLSLRRAGWLNSVWE